MIKPSCLVALLLAVDVAHSQFRNVSVDETDPSISYTPPRADWTMAANTPLDFPFTEQSSHLVITTNDHRGASAVFTFTGVAVYYFSPLWPYPVNSFVSLDGQVGTCIDLSGPPGMSPTPGHDEIVESAPVWHRDGLSNTVHTVTVSACPNSQYIIVDGFIYTVLESSSSTSASVTTTSRVTTTATESGFSEKKRVPTIIAIIATLGGFVALVACVTAVSICLCRRRKRVKHRREPIDLLGDTTNIAYSPLPTTTPFNPTPATSSPPPYTPPINFLGRTSELKNSSNLSIRPLTLSSSWDSIDSKRSQP